MTCTERDVRNARNATYETNTSMRNVRARTNAVYASKRGIAMRKSIAAVAAAGILTIGMFALPSMASADEIAPSTDGLASGTTISERIDDNMGICGNDKACNTIEHVHQTNQQIKSDIDTTKDHIKQLHQNAHEDADAIRHYNEQAWKNYVQDREDVKNALDAAAKRAQERHDTLHQDIQDNQAHLDQLHADAKETHDELKTQHDAFVASSHRWHQSFIAALKEANAKAGQQNGSAAAGSANGSFNTASGSNGTVQTIADNGAANGNGSSSGASSAAGASNNQTAASTGALTKSEYGQLAQTGIGISLACAAVLLFAGLAYAVRMLAQYKRETSED